MPNGERQVSPSTRMAERAMEKFSTFPDWFVDVLAYLIPGAFLYLLIKALEKTGLIIFLNSLSITGDWMHLILAFVVFYIIGLILELFGALLWMIMDFPNPQKTVFMFEGSDSLDEIGSTEISNEFKTTIYNYILFLLRYNIDDQYKYKINEGSPLKTLDSVKFRKTDERKKINDNIALDIYHYAEHFMVSHSEPARRYLHKTRAMMMCYRSISVAILFGLCLISYFLIIELYKIKIYFSLVSLIFAIFALLFSLIPIILLNQSAKSKLYNNGVYFSRIFQVTEMSSMILSVILLIILLIIMINSGVDNNSKRIFMFIVLYILYFCTNETALKFRKYRVEYTLRTFHEIFSMSFHSYFEKIHELINNQAVDKQNNTITSE